MSGPVEGLPLDQQPPAFVERANVYAEARGEGPVGMAAVWHVVNNRAARAHQSRADAIRARAQFSWTNPEDPNYRLALIAYKRDAVAWSVADTVCALCETGLVNDPTFGATHYYNPAVCSPAWGRGHPGWQELAVIGHHVFGRAA